ncbi:amidohydrolase family protein [bacterium]|nr:amidohydrolase family protein [bacterium]MCI0601524.1 amidohydrolase family protein [bacterium]
MKKLFICLLVLIASIISAKEEEKEKEEKPKWDVNNPAPSMKEIAIDTEEGTWMSVDVSPDGKQIIFDLLGDIYSIPFAGGEARALTQGVAWDMQPRFSPNGKWIAFTSDRAGGDNIWIVKSDGSSPQQVTKEDFRLLNNPYWSPDSEFIVARKHFSSTRSLGAGEMWLYHRSGGEGVQLTKRPNEQKDAGEPSFSPDGRYVYFSQDTTPGLFFEYNKNSNTQIYVIQRLDRETGELQPYITGPGGSIRPTPSHNGKSIAFIRRIRGKSVLHINDIESGKVTTLFDGLDRDMQEAWAIHGVYPSMAWTPDDSAIVFWASGKIKKIDVATKEVSEIPFHVKSTRKIQNALRFPVAVAPEQFDVRMLRWVQVSPQGNQVVYEALGHLYVRNLPEGTPRRVTTQNDHFELWPSFSRDGKWIVYTTWDDQNLGSVRIAPAAGGEGKVIVAISGHYMEPVFTPDGTKVVYRSSAGGNLTSPQWSRNAGIYWVSAEGGKSTLITKKGARPHFGAANDRVYLNNAEPNEKPSLPGKSALFSVELDGSDERIHIRTEFATEFQLSPDEKWLAFVELWNAYLTPFVKSGGTIELGPKAKSIPVAKITHDAGEYLHWSGNSQSLHWSLGPELYTRDLKQSFAFIEGAPVKIPDPPKTGTNIGFKEKTDVPSGKVALVGARIITMKGEEVLEDATIVVNGNRIEAIGPKASVTVPSDGHVIDVSGKTIMPGLVDVHWHGGMGEEEVLPEQNWYNYASLAFGVTTIHDPSNDNSEIFGSSELARAGKIVAPRIFSTGTILYGAEGDFKAVVNKLEDAQFHLRRMKKIGAFSVKSYNQPRREQRQQIITAARELKMMVVPEGGSLFQHNMTMIVDGHTGIEHSIPVAKMYNDGFQLWIQSQTGYTPTLVVGYGGLDGESYWYAKTNVWENERLLTFVPREVIDSRSRRRTTAPEEEWNHFNNARIAAELYRKGVLVNIGAHGQREGLAAHWEIWMLSQGGLKPHEALRCATLNGATYLGMEKEIGSLEVGKLADLIVLDKNPLEEIRNSESVRYTMVNGRIYDAATMNEIGNHPKQRAPFFWQ